MERYKNVHEKRIEDIEKDIILFFKKDVPLSETSITALTEKLRISHNEFSEFMCEILSNIMKEDNLQESKIVVSNTNVKNFIGSELDGIVDKLIKKFDISMDEAKKSIAYYVKVP